nr:T9SS type A sorting domain-containing protein [Bacteroidales bacterium]
EGACACEVVSNKSTSLAINEEIDGITIGINPSKGVYADYTYINVFTSDKRESSEALKFEKSNAYKDLVYTHSEANDLAVNSLILDGPAASVPLTISLAGEMDSIVLSYEVTGDENCMYSLIDKHTEDTVLLAKIGELEFKVESDPLIASRFELLVRRIYDVETAIPTLDESADNLISIETAKESIKVSSKITEDLELSIYDVSGKMIKSSSLSSYGEYSSALMTGVYVLTDFSSKGNAEFKLLVE